MSISKSSKMLQYINYRIRVTISDGRQLIGKFMAFDRHMNLVFGDCEEFRKLPLTKGSKEEREDRCTLRGEEVISLTVEGPGMGCAAGRGVVIDPLSQDQPSLAGPVCSMVMLYDATLDFSSASDQRSAYALPAAAASKSTVVQKVCRFLDLMATCRFGV